MSIGSVAGSPLEVWRGALLAAGVGLLVAAAPAPDPHANCMCRANGQRYHVGERVCLNTAAGLRMAECRMAQNVTSWAVQGEACNLSAWAKPSSAEPRS